MSFDNPITILVDSNGVPLGTPTNVLYVSGTSVSFPAVQAVTGSVALSQPAHVIIDSSVTLPVSGTLTTTPTKSSTATVTAVTASTFSTQVLAANPSRLGAIFYNDSSASAYLLFGSGSQFTNWSYRMFPNATVEMGDITYTGVVSAIWASATGSLRTTELT